MPDYGSHIDWALIEVLGKVNGHQSGWWLYLTGD